MVLPAVGQETIAAEVRAYIVSNFLSGEPGEELRDDDLLLEGGVIDSGSVVALVSHLEVRYGIEVREEDLFPENFATIERIAAFVEKQQRV